MLMLCPVHWCPQSSLDPYLMEAPIDYKVDLGIFVCVCALEIFIILINIRIKPHFILYKYDIKVSFTWPKFA